MVSLRFVFKPNKVGVECSRARDLKLKKQRNKVLRQGRRVAGEYTFSTHCLNA